MGLALIPIAFALLLVPGCIALPESTTGDALDTNGKQGGGSATASATAKITLEQVAAHSTSDDCWVIVDGKVYDVTPIMNSHPNVANCITPFCGKDATNSFHAKAHLPSSSAKMRGLYIGDVG